MKELRVEITREDDGRWMADVTAIPGALAYGKDAGGAWRAAVAVALRVVADRLEHGDSIPEGVAELFPGQLDTRLLFSTDLDS